MRDPYLSGEWKAKQFVFVMNRRKNNDKTYTGTQHLYINDRNTEQKRVCQVAVLNYLKKKSTLDNNKQMSELKRGKASFRKQSFFELAHLVVPVASFSILFAGGDSCNIASGKTSITWPTQWALFSLNKFKNVCPVLRKILLFFKK